MSNILLTSLSRNSHALYRYTSCDILLLVDQPQMYADRGPSRPKQTQITIHGIMNAYAKATDMHTNVLQQVIVIVYTIRDV